MLSTQQTFTHGRILYTLCVPFVNHILICPPGWPELRSPWTIFPFEMIDGAWLPGLVAEPGCLGLLLGPGCLGWNGVFEVPYGTA